MPPSSARRTALGYLVSGASLGAESGFDIARQITPYVGSVILISSHDHDEDDDYAELIAGSPAVGFLSKAELSADAIGRLVS